MDSNAKPEDVIAGFVREGIFAVADDGTIWRQRDRGRICHRRAENNSGPYLFVRAMREGRRWQALAHRVVWRFFCGPIPTGMVINHKNGHKKDNRPCNLELTTPSGNVRHAYRTGLKDQRGELNPAAKLSRKDVVRIRLRYAEGGVTQAELGKEHGVSFKTISKIVRGERRIVDGGITADYTTRRRLGGGPRDSKGQFVGKEAAGREFDGRTWDEMPEVAKE